jgi:carboxylesterase
MTVIHPVAEPFFFRGSPEVALLFLHGFGASPSELFPVASLIHARSGLTISAPLLPGHGSVPEELNQTGWTDWFGAAEQEIDFLVENYQYVFVAGLSMGGLLALHAGASTGGLTGVISINAPIYTNYPVLTALTPVIRYVRPYFPKKDDSERRDMEVKGRFAYPVTPVQAFQRMLQLRDRVVAELSELDLPVLVVQSQQDESVHPRSGAFLSRKIENSRLLVLHRSGHIATMGPEQEILAGEIIDFVHQSVN